VAEYVLVAVITVALLPTFQVYVMAGVVPASAVAVKDTFPTPQIAEGLDVVTVGTAFTVIARTLLTCMARCVVAAGLSTVHTV
jgi:hypothetical protein